MSFDDIVAVRAAHAEKQAIKDKKKRGRKRKNAEAKTAMPRNLNCYKNVELFWIQALIN